MSEYPKSKKVVRRDPIPGKRTPLDPGGAHESFETLESRVRAQTTMGGQFHYLEVDWYFIDMLEFLYITSR